MSKARPVKRVFYSSSYDDSYSDKLSENANDLADTKPNQQKNDYSYNYEYSYSSDDNVPPVKPSPQRPKVMTVPRRNFIPPKRNIGTKTPPPKPMKIEQSSESSTQEEDDETSQLKPKSIENQQNNINDNSSKSIENRQSNFNDDTPKSVQQEEIPEASESIAIDNAEDINSQDQNATNDDEKYYNSYFCSKTKKKSPNDFTFTKRNTSFLYAKSKGIFSSHVYISSDENFGIKEKQYEYVMKISHNKTCFQLRRGDDKNDILIMNFDNDYGKEYGPRKIIMEWPNEHLKYFSRIPRKTPSGNWELNFNGKYVLASQKNAIILDENSKPVVMVRKVQKTILQIEVIRNMDPVQLFALGIASFICPF